MSDVVVSTTATPWGELWARWGQRLWWLHSLWALGFGVGVMLLSRRGLAYADGVLLVALAAWLLVFVALRVFGPDHPIGDEPLTRRGLRVATNYLIKNLYQQMFFFQVPLYASSATWSVGSPNLWLPILLAVCAVVSTLDLVFDNVVMRHRWIAALLYGICLFALLNLALPLVAELSHARALLVAGLATPPATALLTFQVRQVLRPFGLFVVVAASVGMGAVAVLARVAVPPAPLALATGAVGHGDLGEYEVLPGKKTRLRADQLDGLRCVTQLVDPGGFRDRVVHVWRKGGTELLRVTPDEVPTDEPNARVVRSALPPVLVPPNPIGRWSCVVQTEDGQLVGRVPWMVLPAAAPAAATSRR